MNREQLEKLLERQITPHVPKTVTLPSIGMELSVRRLMSDEKILAGGAAHDKDRGNRQARSIVAGLRYAAVDDKGDHLFLTFDEALAFLARLDDKDFEALGEVMTEIFSSDDQVTDLEQAKNS